MNMFSVFIKSSLEQLRDIKTLLLIVSSPLVLIIVFAIAFGAGFYTYNVAVTNEDRGSLGKEFITLLKEANYANDNKTFTISEVAHDPEKIKKDLLYRTFTAHLYIPADFTERIEHNNGTAASNVIISGDTAYAFFSLTEITLTSFINEFVLITAGTNRSVTISSAPISENELNSEFDGMVPGLIVISIYFLCILSAMVLTREYEQGTIQRLLLSRLHAWEIYGGITLTQILLGMIMVPLLMFSVYCFGFPIKGSILLVFLIGILAAFSAISIGLIIAAFSRKSIEAFVIGNAVIFPVCFISGIFLPVPGFKLFTLLGRDFELLELILPTVPAVKAMNRVLVNNADFITIAVDLLLMAVVSVIYFIIGAFLFKKRRKIA